MNYWAGIAIARSRPFQLGALPRKGNDMAYIVWPNGRDPSRLWHGIKGPTSGPTVCGKVSPDGKLKCERPPGGGSHCHVAFYDINGNCENIAEWLDNDKGTPVMYAGRDDRPLNPIPASLPWDSLPTVGGAGVSPPLGGQTPPPTPGWQKEPALISKDRQTATFYGEVYELDLIPDATDEDYKTLPTWEALNKGK